MRACVLAILVGGRVACIKRTARGPNKNGGVRIIVTRHESLAGRWGDRQTMSQKQQHTLIAPSTPAVSGEMDSTPPVVVPAMVKAVLCTSWRTEEAAVIAKPDPEGCGRGDD